MQVRKTSSVDKETDDECTKKATPPFAETMQNGVYTY